MSDDALVPHANPLPRLWFGAPPELAPDEKFLRSFAANRMQGRRAVGGGLHLTTRRILFCPNAIDARLGGKRWECSHADVTGIGVEPASTSFWAMFTSARIERLRVALTTGPELFVVRNPARVADELNQILGGDVPPSTLPEARVVKR